jgi:hypothetical protein
MGCKLSYAMLVDMHYADMMRYVAVNYNLSKVVTERIIAIATTSNTRSMLHNLRPEDDEKLEVNKLMDFMENVVSEFIRQKVLGEFKQAHLECDKLHIEPFNCFFPFEVGLSRNVVTKVKFETAEDLNLFKLKEPILYDALLKRSER